MTFGRLLNLLESTLDFEGKIEFIDACRAQNAIRNRLAHELLDGIDSRAIRKLAIEYKDGDEDVVDAFNEATEDFSWYYCSQLVDKRWNEM